MKPKQLANVLIRILGLSMCLHSVPSTIMNVVYGAGFANNPRGYIWAAIPQLIAGLLPLAIGIFLVLRSRWLTEKLFKDEAE
jgi:hypothetical protein